MRNLLIGTMLASSTFLIGQTKADQHSIDVNVLGSHVEQRCGEVRGGSSGCHLLLKLDVMIDGKQYELLDEKTSQDKRVKNELLGLGNYKASLVKDEHSKPYRSYRVYELEFSDGATEQFTVIGQTAH